MTYLYLACFLVGLLLAVRLMFFGAERLRPTPGAIPLRRSEPAVVAFLIMFGVSGYLLSRYSLYSSTTSAVCAALAAIVFAAVVTRVAIATARMQPEHDPEDPRYVLQGRVAVVTSDIPQGSEGIILLDDGGGARPIRARDIAGGAILAGQEVCIDRIDDGVAYVEPWAHVEQRL
ncbi:MAG: hypothetical protein ABIY52_06825 [Gemmatimonadaceae bacterium]